MSDRACPGPPAPDRPPRANGRQRRANGRRVGAMKRLSVLVLCALAAAGCRRTPPAAISVERRGADLVFHFAPCGAPPARIMDLDVTEAGAATATCSLVL